MLDIKLYQTHDSEYVYLKDDELCFEIVTPKTVEVDDEEFRFKGSKNGKLYYTNDDNLYEPSTGEILEINGGKFVGLYQDAVYSIINKTPTYYFLKDFGECCCAFIHMNNFYFIGPKYLFVYHLPSKLLLGKVEHNLLSLENNKIDNAIDCDIDSKENVYIWTSKKIYIFNLSDIKSYVYNSTLPELIQMIKENPGQKSLYMYLNMYNFNDVLYYVKDLEENEYLTNYIHENKSSISYDMIMKLSKLLV